MSHSFGQKNEIELDKNDLIKADAEGADLDVLFGAEDQIRRNSPQIAITTYHVDDHAEKMIMWLREINPEYKLRLKGLSFWTTVSQICRFCLPGTDKIA